MNEIRKKIAIYHNLPSGGGIRMLENIIRRYKNKYRIDIYVIGENCPKTISCTSLNFIEVKPWKGFVFRNLWIFFKLPIIHKRLANKINKQYRLIFVTHDYFTKSPYLFRYLKIKNIYFCHEPQREYYESAKFHAPNIKAKLVNLFRYPIKIIDKTNVRHATRILCNSKYSKIVLKNVYGRDSNIIYPGVNEKFFYPIKKKKAKEILCVGGINPIKDQLFLIKALKPLLSEYKLVLIGNGEKKYLDNILHEGGKNVQIINNISDKRLKEKYQKAKVTCITAHMEPFGLSSIESQACGTPVVVVDEGGPPESIINGKTGYITKRNINDFLNKVIKAIKNKNMGVAARRNIINHWTWDKTLIGLDKILG